MIKIRKNIIDDSWKKGYITLFFSVLVYIINYYTHFANDFYIFKIILYVGFAILLLSKKIRKILINTFDTPVFLINVLAILIRFKYSLFCFLHINRHGPGYLRSIQSPAGFTADLFGFSYEYFWNIPFEITNYLSEKFFVNNLFLNVLTGHLLYLFLIHVFKDKKMARLGFLIFAFSPIQVAVSATESHFNLIAFGVMLLLFILSCDDPGIEQAFVCFVAFFSFIRPETFGLFLPSLIAFFIVNYSHNPFWSSYLTTSASILMLIFWPFFLVANLMAITYFAAPMLSNSALKYGIIPIIKYFNKEYYELFLSLLFPLGMILGLMQKKKRKWTLVQMVFFFYFLPFSLYRLPNWHVGMNYQSHLEIFIIFFIIQFLGWIRTLIYKMPYRVNITSNLEKLSVFAVIVAIFVNFNFRINKTAHLYDEQLEYRFAVRNAYLLEDNDLIFSFSYIEFIAGEFSLFNCDFFHFLGKDIQEFVWIFRKEWPNKEFNKLVEYLYEEKSKSKDGTRFLFYRAVNISDKNFEIFKKQIYEYGFELEFLAGETIIFENRMETVIKDGEIREFALYLLKFPKIRQ